RVVSGASERYLVTGALGCIGAWTVRTLVRQGAAVTTFDLGTDTRRLAQIMTPEELESVELVNGNITDLTTVRAALDDHDITHVTHRAASGVRFGGAAPPLGAMVNVVGTVNVFEAVKARGDRMAPVVYTSSIGMFAAEDSDPETGRLEVDARPHPANHYGVHKLANEGNARVYWLDDGIPSGGPRPVGGYRVGRGPGLTSGPAKAESAAVIGQPYTVPYGGATLYQYAEDAAHILIAASRSGAAGAGVYNMPGTLVDGPGLVSAIEAAVPGAAGLIDIAPVHLPFPEDIASDGVEVLGPVPITPFADGVRESVAIYRELAAAGRL